MSPEYRVDTEQQAVDLLESAYSHFFNALETVARLYPESLRPGYDLEIDQAVSQVWIKYDLPQL